MLEHTSTINSRPSRARNRIDRIRFVCEVNQGNNLVVTSRSELMPAPFLNELSAISTNVGTVAFCLAHRTSNRAHRLAPMSHAIGFALGCEPNFNCLGDRLAVLLLVLTCMGLFGYHAIYGHRETKLEPGRTIVSLWRWWASGNNRK